MRYNPEKAKQRLAFVKRQNRVFIYDATIIIKFLNATFIPVEYFAKKELIINDENEIDRFCLNDIDAMKKYRYTIGDLYNFYLAYRQAMPYTSPIESRSKFMTIMKKLNLHRNGWKFNFMRVGRSQFNYFAPMLLRIHASEEDRLRYPIRSEINIADSQIDIDVEDIIVEPSIPDEPIGELPQEMLKSEDQLEEEYEEGNEFDEITGGNTPIDHEDF